MKKLLLAGVAAVGLAALPGIAHATLTFTIWNDANDPARGLAGFQNAAFPVPGVDLLGVFVSNNDTLAFVDRAPFPTGPTFSSAGYGAIGLNAAQLATPMSSPITGSNISTFIRITESYNLAAPFSSDISHDDGMQIFRDATNTSTGAGAIFVCGNVGGGLTGEIASHCDFPAGSHTLQLLYVEANADPAVLAGVLPPEAVPEPASLALLGAGLLGFGLLRRRRRTS